MRKDKQTTQNTRWHRRFASLFVMIAVFLLCVKLSANYNFCNFDIKKIVLRNVILTIIWHHVSNLSPQTKGNTMRKYPTYTRRQLQESIYRETVRERCTRVLIDSLLITATAIGLFVFFGDVNGRLPKPENWITIAESADNGTLSYLPMRKPSEW